MPEPVRFETNKRKVIEAIVYLASTNPGIDVFHVCKVLFYADLEHFRRYGRPILGDNYFAMDDGPVPSFAYDIMKRNLRMVGAPLLKVANEKLEFDESQGYVTVKARAEFDDGQFSRTDLACLDEAIARFAQMPMLELWRHVHEEPAYKATYRGDHTSTWIPYDLLLPESISNRDKIIEQLRQTSKVTVI